MQEAGEWVEREGSPVAALRRFWLISVVIVLIGLAAGAALAGSQATTSTAESRLAVGQGNLAYYQIPGYATAAEQLAANYARYVSAPTSQRLFRQKLGANAVNVKSVRASPIPGSNVVRIEVEATDADAARQAADLVAGQLQQDVTALGATQSAPSVLAAYTDLSQQVGAATVARDQAQAALNALPAAQITARTAAGQALAQAQSALDVLTVQQDAQGALYQKQVSAGSTDNSLQVVQRAVVTGDDQRSLLERYAAFGVLGGFLAAIIVAVWLDRRRPRRVAVTAEAEQLAAVERQGPEVDVRPRTGANVEVLDVSERATWRPPARREGR